MNCPHCDARLEPVAHSSGPPFRPCTGCGGTWVPSHHYWNWVRRERLRFPSVLEEEKDVPPETGDCPECLHDLREGLAGRGLTFHVRHCAHCGGLWLGAEERAKLSADPDRDLHAIYGTLWRRHVRAPSAPDAAEAVKAAPKAEVSRHFVQISKRKEYYPIAPSLWEYLVEVRRACDFPPIYDQLSQFVASFPCSTPDGSDSLWETVTYDPQRTKDLNLALSRIYSQLKTGNPQSIEHIYIERVDYCEFGNSKPFRVRVVNRFNDNYDHFYVKVPDASRIFGLELEHVLSPNRINYLVHGETLIEEHIAGIPGDVFLKEHIDDHHLNRVRVAKEFVKFNERSFVRLLGDMRSYNYVVDITPDFEEVQFRVRAIDFDQQCYEGEFRVYLPQFFKENTTVVRLCSHLLNYATMQQYQMEERSLIAGRMQADYPRIKGLFTCMREQPLSTPAKIAELREGLNKHHGTSFFSHCSSMSELVEANLDFILAQVS